ncbi:MAG: ATP-binding protein [Marinifilaceae bacterium]|jgi:AAA+ superfamily predicted ATPase|nr:ATP-binding protein [Marinifilaceae bacterium]
MNHIFTINPEKVRLSDMILPERIQQPINSLLQEYRYIDTLLKYKLPVTNKILFYGQSGCGKTMLARALSTELNKKMKVISLSNIVSSKLGETSRNIAAAFKIVENQEAILFLDEFDSLGKERDYDDTDNSEMKRVVNSIIQLIDALPQKCLLIAATNQINLIDKALVRRFETRLEFDLPTKDLLDDLYDSILSKFPTQYTSINRSYGLSFSEAKNSAIKQVKQNVIESELSKEENN